MHNENNLQANDITSVINFSRENIKKNCRVALPVYACSMVTVICVWTSNLYYLLLVGAQVMIV